MQSQYHLRGSSWLAGVLAVMMLASSALLPLLHEISGCVDSVENSLFTAGCDDREQLYYTKGGRAAALDRGGCQHHGHHNHSDHDDNDQDQSDQGHGDEAASSLQAERSVDSVPSEDHSESHERKHRCRICIDIELLRSASLWTSGGSHICFARASVLSADAVHSVIALSRRWAVLTTGPPASMRWAAFYC